MRAIAAAYLFVWCRVMMGDPSTCRPSPGSGCGCRCLSAAADWPRSCCRPCRCWCDSLEACCCCSWGRCYYSGWLCSAVVAVTGRPAMIAGASYGHTETPTSGQSMSSSSILQLVKLLLYIYTIKCRIIRYLKTSSSKVWHVTYRSQICEMLPTCQRSFVTRYLHVTDLECVIYLSVLWNVTYQSEIICDTWLTCHRFGICYLPVSFVQCYIPVRDNLWHVTYCTYMSPFCLYHNHWIMLGFYSKPGN